MIQRKLTYKYLAMIGVLGTAAFLRELPELNAKYILHSKRRGQICGNISISASIRININFLQGVNIGRNFLAQNPSDLIEFYAPFYVPAHNSNFLKSRHMVEVTNYSPKLTCILYN